MRKTKHPDEVASAIKALIGDERQLVLTGDVIDEEGDVIKAEGIVMACLDVVYSVPKVDEPMPALVVRPGVVKSLSSPDGKMPILYMPIRSVKAMRY